MADLKFSVEVAGPPNEVFAFFVPQRMPLWYGTEMNARIQMQGGASEFRAGQKLRITGTLKGREIALEATISAYEWEKLLEWQFGDSYGVRGMQQWEVSRTAAGTQVAMRDSYRMPGLYGRIVDCMVTRFAVSMRDRAWLKRLQRLVERR
jgi:uncharacterized protein YndB with AHSA1/START domain